MELTEIVNLFINNGLAVGITAYFLYRDFKFNAQLIETLSSLKDAVSSVKDIVDKE